MVGRQVSVYVRDEDADLWAQAEQYARMRRLSMSALVLTALEQYLAGRGQTGT
jgi:hypothetical protein